MNKQIIIPGGKITKEAEGWLSKIAQTDMED